MALQTHGCRLNQAESDSMARLLARAGHQVVDTVDRAEVLVLNTCAITHRADADARRAIRSARRHNPDLKVAVTGCWAEAEPEDARALDGVFWVLGNRDKAHLARHLSPDPLVPTSRLLRTPDEMLPAAPPRRRTRALLKVQDGCDFRCSFCIVPRVRGPSRSLDVDHLVSTTRGLVEEGVPEVVLTGVHLGTYGRDLRPRRSLADLVAALVPVLGRARLRLSSVDPHEVDDALVELMAAHPDRICPHLHLPTQSAEDGTLRRMRRAHRAHHFVSMVERLAARIPGVSLGTDVIVGHPGETDASFRETARVLESLPLSYLHVFPFSVRRGTAAAAMGDAVDATVRKGRARELGELSRDMQTRFRRSQAGTQTDVVVYRRAPQEGLRGLTANYLEVQVRGPDDIRGRRVRGVLDRQGRVATVRP